MYCLFSYMWGCHACMLSRVQLFVSLWSVAQQAPLSMAFSRQEYLCSVQSLSNV